MSGPTEQDIQVNSISLEQGELPVEPIKVVMVAACPFPANHGTPGAIRELALHLVNQGHEVHIVAYPQCEDIPVEGLHIHRVKVPFFIKPGPIVIGPSFERVVYDMLLVPKLIKVIKKEQIDVIHAHNYEANIAGAMAKLFTGKPLIYNGVNTMEDELPSYRFIRPDGLARWIGRMLDYIVPRMSDLIMVLSDELRDLLVDHGNSKDKVLVVPPGVELEWLASGDGAKVRTKLGLDDDTSMVLYTGALEAFQRVDYLIRAMALVIKQAPSAKLVIACNVKNEKAQRLYSELSQELGISEHVIFVDSVPLEELPDYLAAADVTVVPRPSCPGYPIKLLNYMAASKPVVSFAGSAKSLCHGYSGYIATNDDVDDLANGIAMFVNNPEVGVAMGARARESLEGVFDWSTLAKGVAESYRQLIKNRKEIDRVPLAKYFRHSYTPLLKDPQQVTPFLKDGKLIYPSLLQDKL